MLRLAMLNLLVGTVLALSPNLVQRAYASAVDTCSVTCRNGSCSASGNCTCTCSFWTSTATCSCAGGEGGESPGDTISS